MRIARGVRPVLYLPEGSASFSGRLVFFACQGATDRPNRDVKFQADTGDAPSAGKCQEHFVSFGAGGSWTSSTLDRDEVWGPICERDLSHTRCEGSAVQLMVPSEDGHVPNQTLRQKAGQELTGNAVVRKLRNAG